MQGGLYQVVLLVLDAVIGVSVCDERYCKLMESLYRFCTAEV